MPNHFHGVLMIVDDSECTGLARQARTPQVPQFSKPQPDLLGTIIGAFKSAVTRRINAQRSEHKLPPAEVWHRNYFERVVRNEKELDDTRRYIAQNPLNWEIDEHHPDADQVEAFLR